MKQKLIEIKDLPANKRFIRPLPMADLEAKWLKNYDTANYEGGISAWVLNRTHGLIERPFTSTAFFSQVLEVGAGTLAHLKSVRHGFDRYIASDHDEKILNSLRAKTLPSNVELLHLDGRNLPFPENTFNRLIATHVLEHVSDPHLALAEWVRVVRPGGVISLILPCDPGFLWRLGRNFGPRRKAEQAGLPYDYYMAREHINSIFNLDEIIKYQFPQRKTVWWPMRVPAPNLNLIYGVNLYV